MSEPPADTELHGEAKLYLDPLRATPPPPGFAGRKRADFEKAPPVYGEPLVEGQPHPKIAHMIAHWRELAPAPGILPGRQHFDPIRVPAVLPNIWLMDVVREASVRYRIRLVGGALVDAGAPMRPGMFLEELGGWVDPRHMSAIFDIVARDRVPNWRRGTPAIRHSRYISQLERVFLPFAADGQTVDLIMGVTVFYRGDGQTY